MITADGTMNYESGDVFIFISFKTPIDINETSGLYAFPSGAKESPFSGIYRVILCENQFNGGEFRQRLECIRMPGQASDHRNGTSPAPKLPIEKPNSLATKTGKTEDDKSSPQQNTVNKENKVT
jgi:hypothetical protein